MKIESQKEIDKTKFEIEQELKAELNKIESDFTFEDVKEIIYHEKDQDDLMKAFSVFDRGQDFSELQNLLELINDAWNYFSHKSLKGKSPAEVLLEHQKKSKN